MACKATARRVVIRARRLESVDRDMCRSMCRISHRNVIELRRKLYQKTQNPIIFCAPLVIDLRDKLIFTIIDYICILPICQHKDFAQFYREW